MKTQAGDERIALRGVNRSACAGLASVPLVALELDSETLQRK